MNSLWISLLLLGHYSKFCYHTHHNIYHSKVFHIKKKYRCISLYFGLWVTNLPIRIRLKNILAKINWLKDTVTGNSMTGDDYLERKWKNHQKDEWHNKRFCIKSYLRFYSRKVFVVLWIQVLDVVNLSNTVGVLKYKTIKWSQDFLLSNNFWFLCVLY